MSPLLALLSVLPGFEKELRLLPYLLRPGRVCADIGASLGVYSIPMAVLVGVSGAVLAFEPRSDAARRLRRLASLLALPALQVETAALGASPGTGTLVVPRRRRPVPGRSFMTSGALHSRLDDRLCPGLELDVPITTLDAERSRLRRPIDFIKCDVEGAEHAVFEGGRLVLENDRPIVLCEIEERHTRRYGHTTADVFELFSRFEYCTVAGPPDGSLSGRNVLLVPTERRMGHLPAAARDRVRA